MKWIFWRLAYLFRSPVSLADYLLKVDRCWNPWRKFRPCVRHNDDGDEWTVYFTDERSYVERMQFNVECHIGCETGDIVGFNVWDKTLKKSEA